MYSFLFLSAKSHSTICNGTAQSLGIIVGGAVGGGFVFLVFIIVIFISFLVGMWACCKLITERKDKEAQRKHDDKQSEREHEDKQGEREHEIKMKELELKEKLRSDPRAVVTEILMQIYDNKTNTDEVRIAIISALCKLTPGLTPRSATHITANGASAIPITIQAEPVKCGVTKNGSDVVVEMEMEQIKQRVQDDGGHALAGPPPPPPPTYEQSMNHPMVIIEEQESPEVLEALKAFIGGFSGAVEESNVKGNDLGHTVK